MAADTLSSCKSFEMLPDELVGLIVRYAFGDYRDRFRLRAVNKRWLRVIHSNWAWADVHELSFEYSDERRGLAVWFNQQPVMDLSYLLQHRAVVEKDRPSGYLQLVELVAKTVTRVTFGAEEATSPLITNLFPVKCHGRLVVRLRAGMYFVVQHKEKQKEYESVLQAFNYFAGARYIGVFDLSLNDEQKKPVLSVLAACQNLGEVNISSTVTWWFYADDTTELVLSVFRDKPMRVLDLYDCKQFGPILQAIKPGFLTELSIKGSRSSIRPDDFANAAAALVNVRSFYYEMERPAITGLQTTDILRICAELMPRCELFHLDDWHPEYVLFIPMPRPLPQDRFLTLANWITILSSWACKLSQERPSVTLRINRPLPGFMQKQIASQLPEYHVTLHKHKPRCGQPGDDLEERGVQGEKSKQIVCDGCKSSWAIDLRFLQLFIRPHADSPFLLTVNIKQSFGDPNEWNTRQNAQSDEEDEDDEMWEDVDTDEEDTNDEEDTTDEEDTDEEDTDTTTAFVRFGGEVEQTAAAAVAKAQEEAGEGQPLLFEEKPLTVTVLDGDEEADFHVKHADQKRMRAEANKKAQRLKQDEYRNNKGRDKKRGRRQGNETNGGAPVASGKKTVFPDSDDEPDTDTPTSKAPKTEDKHTPVETNANATNTEEEPKKTDTVIG